MDKKKNYERSKSILENMFEVYFYALKMDVKEMILAQALEGMSKYAHLINVELLLDIIPVVSEKLANEDNSLTMESKLHCVLTVFKCLTGFAYVNVWGVGWYFLFFFFLFFFCICMCVFVESAKTELCVK